MYAQAWLGQLTDWVCFFPGLLLKSMLNVQDSVMKFLTVQAGLHHSGAWPGAVAEIIGSRSFIIHVLKRRSLVVLNSSVEPQSQKYGTILYRKSMYLDRSTVSYTPLCINAVIFIFFKEKKKQP